MKQIKLERKFKLRIIIGIAIAFILYGLLDGIFKFNISKKIVDNVSLVLMVIAFSLIFSNRRSKKDDTNSEPNSDSPDNKVDQ